MRCLLVTASPADGGRGVRGLQIRWIRPATDNKRLVGSRLSARRTTGPRLPTVAAAAALDQTDPLPRVKAVTVDHNDAASHQVRVITFDLRLTNCQHSPANRQLRILPRKYAHHVCPLSVFVALPLALYVDGIHAACQRCRPESVRLGAPGDGKGQ